MNKLLTKILSEDACYADFFKNNASEIGFTYKKLCKKIHPDACKDPRASDAFARLQAFYNEAADAIAKGTWAGLNYVEFKTKTGKTLQIRYSYRREFELGEYLVCDRNIIYIFDFSKKKYYNNYINQIKDISFVDKEMEKMFKPLFPDVLSEYDTVNDQHIIVLRKTEDVYPLRAVIENFYNGKVPATHMAWMMSRLLNICCYLKFKGFVNNGINLDNCFVSLEFHTILLFGWWYTVKEDTKMIGTTKDILDIMPPKVKADKIACSTTDIESVKAFGRKYIGDDAPDAFLNYLNSGSLEDSMKEMEKWDKALVESFGKRRFIKIEATKKDIYK